MLNHRAVAKKLARVCRQLAILTEMLMDATPVMEHAEELPKLEKAIITVLSSGESLPAKLIAKRAGYAYGGRMRSTLATMCRDGILTHNPEGYKLASPSARPQANGVNGQR